MVKNVIPLNERESRIINSVKSKYGLKDKSQALNIILKRYEEYALEPQFKPEFVKEVEETEKRGKFVKVKDFVKD
jgi:hypothetical protein